MNLKQAYQQSQCHEGALKILRTTARNEVFQYRELNRNLAKQCHHDNIRPINSPIQLMIKIPPPETRTFDDLVKWCAMPKGELQYYNASCFKRVANFTDYVDHHQHFSLTNNAIYIWHNAVGIPVTCFPYDE